MNLGLSRYLAAIQGLYFFSAGIWPLLDIDSFIAVTGPKFDIWLVRTVGGLVTVIGVTLLIAAVRGVHFEIKVLAAGCALCFLLIDVIYSIKGLLSWVYLMDGLFELLLLAGWIGLMAISLRERRVAEDHYEPAENEPVGGAPLGHPG